MTKKVPTRSVAYSHPFCLLQVFVELAKEQEEEDSSFGTLNSTLWWERTQEDRVIFWAPYGPRLLSSSCFVPAMILHVRGKRQSWDGWGKLYLEAPSASHHPGLRNNAALAVSIPTRYSGWSEIPSPLAGFPVGVEWEDAATTPSRSSPGVRRFCGTTRLLGWTAPVSGLVPKVGFSLLEIVRLSKPSCRWSISPRGTRSLVRGVSPCPRSGIAACPARCCADTRPCEVPLPPPADPSLLLLRRCTCLEKRGKNTPK